MTTLQTVVVATDFSAGSEAALVRGADLAARAGAALHLLHADVLFHASGDGAPPDATPSSALRVRAERFAARVLGLEGPGAFDALAPTVAIVREVAPAAAILRYVEEADADLVVLGTHGRSGLLRLLLGSVAEAVVAGASCPVLTVPHRASDAVPTPSQPVLVAIDFSDRSRAALAAGRRLAALFGADVELVHVVRDAGPYPGFTPNILSLVDYDPARGEATRERLARFAETAEGPAPAAVHVGLGEPAHVVPALAEERNAGAIVMGTHGRTGVAHALIGSVAGGTLRRAPCPVLTLKQAERLGRRPVRSVLA